jgi:hypothetical protein
MSFSMRISIAWPPDIPPSEIQNASSLLPSTHFIDLGPFKSSCSLDWGMTGYQITAETPESIKKHQFILSHNSLITVTFIHTVGSWVPQDAQSVKDEGYSINFLMETTWKREK